MNEPITLQHEFVEFVPNELHERKLYVSIKFATVAHLCVCGCGNKVVTPLRPKDWKLLFDGKSISLFPSIGNWSFECRSHYWITKNRVSWAEHWSDERIQANRDYDQLVQERYYAQQEEHTEPEPDIPPAVEIPRPKAWWRKFLPWL